MRVIQLWSKSSVKSYASTDFSHFDPDTNDGSQIYRAAKYGNPRVSAKEYKKRRNFSKLLPSDSCRIQTCNLLIRSQMLYSVELTNRLQYVFFGDSCRIQTCNLLIRSQMLYSVELTNRLQSFPICECKVTTFF